MVAVKTQDVTRTTIFFKNTKYGMILYHITYMVLVQYKKNKVRYTVNIKTKHLNINHINHNHKNHKKQSGCSRRYKFK